MVQKRPPPELVINNAIAKAMIIIIIVTNTFPKIIQPSPSDVLLLELEELALCASIECCDLVSL